MNDFIKVGSKEDIAFVYLAYTPLVCSSLGFIVSTSLFWRWFSVFVVLFLIYLALDHWARGVTEQHKSFRNAQEMLRANQSGKGPKLKVLVVGSGISGIGALKVCLEEGFDPVCYDADLEENVGGFWRYKEDDKQPSVYRTCHIDTDRDLAGYSDRLHDIDNTPLLIGQSHITQYLRDNCNEFKLWERIVFRRRVDSVTPEKKDKKNNGTIWKVKWTDLDAEGKTLKSGQELFEGVFVCTGRHGGGAYVPSIEGLDSTKVPVLHSSKYKYPEKHDLVGKTVVVVGNGNSGCDIVTDLCRKAEKTILVSRSGVWLQKPGHGENAFSEGVGETLAIEWFFRLPWFFITEIWERKGLFNNQDMKKDQEILNKHGLKPKHRLFQQHYGNMTGLHCPNGRTVHSELEAGYITVKKGIERFTEHGVVFTGDSSETKVDMVIMATGFKQHCSFVDPQVVDLRWSRKGNDVPLWLGCFPISEHNRICFVNFIQSITFLAADLQPRLAARMFRNEIDLPSLEERELYMKRLRDAMAAQHMDRQQLRVQYGGTYNYYKLIATWLGCYPSLSLLLKERPTAIWHAWFTTWNPSQYRLVGPGRLECAETDIERMHYNRFYGFNFHTREQKQGPYNRGWSPVAWFLALRNLLFPVILVLVAKLLGYCVSDDLADHLEDYVAYAQKHDALPHSFNIGEDAADVKVLGKGSSVWDRK